MGGSNCPRNNRNLHQTGGGSFGVFIPGSGREEGVPDIHPRIIIMRIIMIILPIMMIMIT